MNNDTQLKLVLPTNTHKNSFLDYMKELLSNDKIQNDYLYKITQDFDSFVNFQIAQAKEESVTIGDVSKTQYWLVKDNEVIG